MYLLTVIVLMFVAPVASIYADHSYLHATAPLIELAGKWFAFWSAGVRLFVAGLRQFFQPRFTSEQIFGIYSDDALPFVRELGVANFAIGLIGIISLAKPGFTLPVAIAAGTFLGVAGVRHLTDKDRTGNENIAMVSDLFVFLVLAAYVVFVGWA
jgi:hypothetical protein